MSYKSLLVHLDNSERTPQRLDAALHLARRFHAHLTGLYATFEPDSRAFYVMAGTADYYATHERRREQQRGAIERLFHAEALRAKVDARFVCANGPANASVPQHARYADLVVMGGYGHARWQKLVLGGVTRTMLMSMTVPVLMSH